MPNATFPDQVKSSLINICNLFTKCNQRYALHCSDNGRFAQLIFGADLVRTQRNVTNCDTPAAITQLLINHFVSFEEKLGSYVKTLAFFIHSLLVDQSLSGMNNSERRLFFSNIYEKLNSIKYTSINQNIIEKDELNIEAIIGHILDTLPRIIFDRQEFYHNLLARLVRRTYI